MEPGSLDDLQPQDVSTSSMPTVIDLSRREEEHVLASAPHDVLRMVKSPGWYPDSRTTTETGSSDVTLQAGERVQPDNALSHTTVTVSYVSRSHVFSTHSSLSQHMPLYTVSPISKFSFHPLGDTDNGPSETSYTLNQDCLEQMQEPLNLALQSEPAHPFSLAQSGPDTDVGTSFAPEPLGLNGGNISSDGFLEELLGDNEQHKFPENKKNGLENVQHNGWSSSGALSESSPEVPVREEDDERGSSDVLFVMSQKQDSDSTGARGLCSLSKDYRSPLEDPVSPSATSLDDVTDVFLLPQASSSPSADASYPERDEGGLERNSKKEPEPSQPGPSVEMKVPKFSPPLPPSNPPKNNPGKTKRKSPGSKVSPTAKTKPARTPKRRRKKPRWSQTSLIFAPKEPEIKLKYVNYKEDKRDPRLDAFSPFVHVERQESSPSLCALINYPEEVKTPPKKGQQQAFISPAVPSTSCLRLGRPAKHSQQQRALVCCLCGLSANAVDLGDLHGPYYPEGYRPNTKAPSSGLSLKEDEDDFSDSDSSSCSVRARSWALVQAAQPKQKGLRGGRSPAAKRSRSDTGPADVQDWYSPPVLPQELCEYWLHEDCGIWSAGVFLVKGRVYGLEEAVKVAQETVKMLM
ncbi:transcription factor 20 [Nematolebias whitei]|uniref:transcription factor 20 n=1 Tax=Nematolebias whitei TaxID=451745 RepID=UPI001898DA16|nr:transcription factor 20 [Nematolebias whitei]